MIIQDYHPRVGGAERQLAALAPRLRAQNVDIRVLTRRYAGLSACQLIDGVPVHRLPVVKPGPLASLAFTLAALPLLKQIRPDVIHAHGLFSPTTTAVAAKRWLKVPVVVKVLRGGHLGDLDRLRQKPFGQRRIRTFRKQVDAFITISQEIDDELSQAGIVAGRRVAIPNGVDVDRFHPLPPAQKSALRASFNLPDDPIVMYAGRLEPEKRVDQLIDVWPVVRKFHPTAVLLILGSGNEESRLKNMAGEGILFGGRVDNVERYLQVADIFVLPSATEGLSNALLEAMAAGLPVISTAVGGAPDIIEHRHNGWLIPPNAGQPLTEAVMALLADETCRHNLGHKARERVMRSYALSTTATQLRALYDKLILSRNERF